MMKIKIAIRDKVGKNFTIKEIQRVEILSESDLERIARACEEVIQANIIEKSANSTGKMASGFYAHKISDGWAVGDIDELDSTIPYWNHQDKGSEGIGANWNHFLPKGRWFGGRWVESADGFSGIKPKTPIPAMNYIAATLQRMQGVIQTILRGKR